MDSIEGIDDVELNNLTSALFTTPKDEPISEEEKNRLKRIKEAAAPIIAELPFNNLKSIENVQIAEETATIQKTNEVSKPIRQILPNIGLKMLQAGLKVEKFKSGEIVKNINEVSDIQKTIDQLIDLSGKFAIHADTEDEKKISPEIRSLCDSLKEKGIDILPENEIKVTRERIVELKAQVSAHTDRLKTDLQKKFTTEIQVKIQEIQSILECLKTIEKYVDRLHSNIIQRSGSR